MVGKGRVSDLLAPLFRAKCLSDSVGGSLSSRWEVELRGEYHKTRGDQTKDIFTRLYIPVVKGRVGVNVSWVFQEWYEMSPEVRDERYAVELKSPW